MKKLFLFLLAIMPTFLFAHAGHDFFQGSSLMHYLTSPAHVLSVAGAIAVIVLLKKRKKSTA
jgi:hypothetical protein